MLCVLLRKARNITRKPRCERNGLLLGLGLDEPRSPEGVAWAQGVVDAREVLIDVLSRDGVERISVTTNVGKRHVLGCEINRDGVQVHSRDVAGGEKSLIGSAARVYFAVFASQWE